MTSNFLIKLFIILFFSIICSIQDIKTKKVSNMILILSWIIMMIYLAVFELNQLPTALLRAFLILTLLFAGKLLSKGQLGTADILFGPFIGLSLSYIMALIAILISVLLSFGFIQIIKFKNHIKPTEIKISFIPFLSAGLLISFFIEFFI